MGLVYLAQQRGLKRDVAYKMLTNVGSVDPDSLERFRSEAETLAKLQHTGIVQVYDSGTNNGSPFLAMEYVDGGSLAEKLRDDRLDPRSAAHMMATVASAVGHAHAHGIIHRDLKPGNILLTANGQPKVADFGLARDIGSKHLTRTGYIAGTPCYMSPEQLSGQRNLTPTVDVWAIGVMLYELLAGTVPFGGSDPQQILTNILRREPVSLRHWHPTLPRDLETICMKCLQKEPQRRYASGIELADDLLRFLDGQAIQARPVGWIEKSQRWVVRNPLAAGLIATVAMILVLATGISLLFAQHAFAEREKATAHAIRADENSRIAHENEQRAHSATQQEHELRQLAEQAVAAEKKAKIQAFEMTSLFESLLKSIRPGPNPLQYLKEEMEATRVQLEQSSGDPLVLARLFYTMALVQRNLGEYEFAVNLMEKALKIRTVHLGEDHEITNETKIDMAYSYYHVHRNAEAIALIRPILSKRTIELGEESQHVQDLMNVLCLYYSGAGMLDEESKLSEHVLAIHTRKYGPDHPKTEWTRVNMRKYQVCAGNFRESIPVFRKAYAMLLNTHGPDDVRTKWTRLTLGVSLLRDGRPREAFAYLEPNYHTTIKEQGLFHVHSFYATDFLAECYEGMKRYEDAIPLRKRMFTYYTEQGMKDKAKVQEVHLNRDLQSTP